MRFNLYPDWSTLCAQVFPPVIRWGSVVQWVSKQQLSRTIIWHYWQLSGARIVTGSTMILILCILSVVSGQVMEGLVQLDKSSIDKVGQLKIEIS